MLEKFQKLKQRSDEEALIEIEHTLMSHYGFISIEELKKLPIPFVLELMDRIAEESEKMERKMKRRK